MKQLGRHLLIEYTGCDKAVLNDEKKLEAIFKTAAQKAGATIVQSVFHRYNPQGISGVIVIAESHLSIHTWPEYCYAAVDLFTCGESVDPYKGHDYITQELVATEVFVREIPRGIPSFFEEKLAHKP